ncbi:hypothetical protein SAMN04488126_10895 [Bhargavaea beijingensis]|uniref:Uncharacterized protein n=1 Tax=Bhargavaea beijingensis TaxID=426756 RepID=A0A1G7CTN9_9BACL|nr:hypothetical protein SAMN04488126_10895 [Bhargavaea beijingensis]
MNGRTASSEGRFFFAVLRRIATRKFKKTSLMLEMHCEAYYNWIL